MKNNEEAAEKFASFFVPMIFFDTVFLKFTSRLDKEIKWINGVNLFLKSKQANDLMSELDKGDKMDK